MAWSSRYDDFGVSCCPSYIRMCLYIGMSVYIAMSLNIGMSICIGISFLQDFMGRCPQPPLWGVGSVQSLERLTCMQYKSGWPGVLLFNRPGVAGARGVRDIASAIYRGQNTATQTFLGCSKNCLCHISRLICGILNHPSRGCSSNLPLYF